MRLSLKQEDQEFVIETEESGQDLNQMCQFFKQLLLGAGYVFDGDVVIESFNE